MNDGVGPAEPAPATKATGHAASAQSPVVADGDYQRRLSAAYVDDVTWLALGKGLLEGTLPALNEQAKSLGTSIGWFWTLYSAVILAGAIVPDVPLRGNLWLVAPILTILGAYLLAMRAQSPIMRAVDLQSPADIRQSFQESVARKRAMIAACQGALVVTAILIGAGIAALVR